VGSGSCGSRLVELSSLQLASFTILPACPPVVVGASGSTMLRPVTIEKEGVVAEQPIELRHHRVIVRDRLGFELAQRFRSTRAELNFIAHSSSILIGRQRPHARQRATRSRIASRNSFNLCTAQGRSRRKPAAKQHFFEGYPAQVPE